MNVEWWMMKFYCIDWWMMKDERWEMKDERSSFIVLIDEWKIDERW